MWMSATMSNMEIYQYDREPESPFACHANIFQPVSIISHHSCFDDITWFDCGECGCILDPVIHDHRSHCAGNVSVSHRDPVHFRGDFKHVPSERMPGSMRLYRA